MKNLYSALWARTRWEGFVRLAVLFAAAALALLAAGAPARAAGGAHDALELVSALRDDDPDVRAIAAGLLAEVPAARVVDALSLVLGDPAEQWRVKAIATRSLAALARRGASGAEERLVLAARDACTDWRVRVEALAGLATLDAGLGLSRATAGSRPVIIPTPRVFVPVGTPLHEAEPLILEALADPDPRVRRLAVLACVGEDVPSLPLMSALSGALRDEDADVRRLTAWALGAGRGPSLAQGLGLAWASRAPVVVDSGVFTE